MAVGFRDYVRECLGEVPGAYRRGMVAVTVIANIALIVALYLGWHLNAFTALQLVSAGVLFAALEVLIFFPYRLWKSNQAEIEKLTDQLTPKLKHSFSMDDPACVCREIQMTKPGGGRLLVTYFRVKVEVVGVAMVAGCSGNLTSAIKDGIDRLRGESPSLPFSPLDGEDALSKTIKPKVPAYLDLLAVHPEKGVILLFKGQRNPTVSWSKLFREEGDYALHIVINAENSAPYEFDMTFRWTLNPATSTFF
jgi:hypothetical protein